MLECRLHKLGKKYNREWIYRNLDYTIPAGGRLLIQGGNGSGKSTLLQTIAGFVTATEGSVEYQANNQRIEPERMRHYVSFASPYLQLIEEFTAQELIDHLRSSKPFIDNLSSSQIVSIAQLNKANHKFIRQYSSGMKQRLKLAIAIMTDTPLLLLDEPLSNLDKNGATWYAEMINAYAKQRTIVVCSNAIPDEHFFCNNAINVMDYKIAN